MDFQKTEQRYPALNKQRSRGSLTAQEFTNRVNELRLDGNNGVWWQVREEEGGWFRWTGDNLVKEIPVYPNKPVTPTVLSSLGYTPALAMDEPRWSP
jgi:hypothetical protein